MRQLVEELVKLLVDQPEEVSVTESEGDEGIVLHLKVAPDDLGKVIGKRGHTAQAIRTLLEAAATKARKHYTLQIIE